MSDYPGALHLFEAFGIELEYMIVNNSDLSVAPITDQVIFQKAGDYRNEVESDDNISWSNELALHVIELKTTQPVKSLSNLDKSFHANVIRIQSILNQKKCSLLPGAMHPTMDPDKEMRLWPHDYNPIYEAFNRIFSCKGHGWSNLQSMHINLPFCGDDEFGRLHAAIRLVLPILPALAASSPIYGGKSSGFLDSRMEVYRTNSAKIPSITGGVIPEPLFSYDAYQEMLNRIYKDIAPYDPNGTLQEEWVNSRGAIARFDRNTIEIRVIDVQECPRADIAIAALVIETIRDLVTESTISYSQQKAWHSQPLQKIFLETIRDGENSVINNSDYLTIFGIKNQSLTAGQLWKNIFARLQKSNTKLIDEYSSTLTQIISSGSLSSRIKNSTGDNSSKESILSTYRQLGQCLKENKLFL